MDENSSDIKKAKILIALRKMSYEENLVWYNEMLDAFIKVQDGVAEAKIKVNFRWKDSETLVNKLIFHLIALKGLYIGTEISINGGKINGKIKDISSIYVMIRAILENLLIYNHIFISSKEENEVKFKHDIWNYTSLIGRQRITPFSLAAKEIHLKEKNQIIDLKNQIENNVHFKKLTDSQQKGILKKGDTRIFKPWSTLIDEMGFGNAFGIRDAYFIMSNHAHSEAISIMQINESNNETGFGQIHMLKYSVLYGMILISRIFLIQLKKYKILELKFNMLPRDIRDRVIFIEELSHFNVKND